MTDPWADPVTRTACSQCGTSLAPEMLACPGCHRLVHADALKHLAAQGEQAEREGRTAEALVAWQDVLSLLPTDTRQYEVVAGKISTLGQAVDSRRAPVVARNEESPVMEPIAETPQSRGAGGAAGLGAGLVLFLKGFAALPKISTFLSMFLMLGVYWAAYGWKFALGLIACFYVYEMGQLAALMRYGIRPNSSFFIPGYGTYARSRQHLVDPRQEAMVGLAGPLWGLGASLAFLGFFALTQEGAWAAVAVVSGWFNLFGLLPFGPLPGGRAFRVMSSSHRWFCVLAISLLWSRLDESQVAGLLILLMIVAAGYAMMVKPAAKSDLRTTLYYIALVVALALLNLAPVPNR